MRIHVHAVDALAVNVGVYHPSAYATVVLHYAAVVVDEESGVRLAEESGFKSYDRALAWAKKESGRHAR